MTPSPAPLSQAPDTVRIGGLCFTAGRPLDGAMGSELLARGAAGAAGEPLALWGRNHRAAVCAVHRAYRAAGAQWITANTFLAHAAGGGEASALVREAVLLAREAAGKVPVAVSFAPGASPALYRDLSRAAADAGAALALVETFLDKAETVAATRAVASSGMPVVASVVPAGDARTCAIGVWEAARALAEVGAAAVGVNCQPPDVLGEALRCFAAKPLPVPVVARPSAGIPVREGETLVYPWAPESWAAAAKALLRAAGSAALVGGCCGAGPAHIAALARLLAAEPST